MSNELSIMPFTALDRKISLMRAGVSMTQIAGETGTDKGFVSHIVAGRKWGTPRSWRVMERVADVIGAPVPEVFPGADRRVSA